MKPADHISFERHFDDFAHLTEETQGWNLEFTKLDKGPFKGYIQQSLSPKCITTRGIFKSQLKQAGAPPPGMRTFAISRHLTQRLIWRNHIVTGNDLLIFPENGELNASTLSNFDMHTISILEDDLLVLADQLNYKDTARTLRQTETIACLRKDLTRLIQTAQIPIQTTGRAYDLHLREVHTQLLKLIHSGHNHPPQKISPNRRRLLSQTDAIVLAQSDAPPTVQALCNTLGVSKRTLEYTFQETYSVTPKFYINALRLNNAFKSLKTAPSPSLKISDVANTWGFWHMGQFAADYKKLFGELPSDTLRRRI